MLLVQVVVTNRFTVDILVSKKLNKIYENILGIIYSIIFTFLIVLGLALISSTKEVLIELF